MPTVIYCPKCDSERVQIVPIQKPEVRRVSIDDLDGRWIGGVRLPYGYQDVYSRAVCMDCLYTREYVSAQVEA